MGAAYQGAFEAVFAILIGVLAGHWADGALGTRPWLLLLGFAIGFGSFVLRLVRLGQRLDQLAKQGAESDPACETKPKAPPRPPSAGPMR